MDEAASLLEQHGDDASLYAGGTELLLAMKEGLLRYSHLVNLKTVSGSDRLEVSNNIFPSSAPPNPKWPTSECAM